MITEVPPDNVGSCLSFLCQQLRVVHHLFQKANYSSLQLCVHLKVLRNHRLVTEVKVFYLKAETHPVQDKRVLVKGKGTCECLVTQWRSTFKTLLVAALLMTNSLSPFLWSVGKPAARTVTVRALFLYTHTHTHSFLKYHLIIIIKFLVFLC